MSARLVNYLAVFGSKSRTMRSRMVFFGLRAAILTRADWLRATRFFPAFDSSQPDHRERKPTPSPLAHVHDHNGLPEVMRLDQEAARRPQPEASCRRLAGIHPEGIAIEAHMGV